MTQHTVTDAQSRYCFVILYGIKEPTVPPSGQLVIWQMELNENSGRSVDHSCNKKRCAWVNTVNE